MVKKKKKSACNAGDQDSMPRSERSPGERKLPTPVFLPGESHGRGAWQATVHSVAKNGTRLSD